MARRHIPFSAFYETSSGKLLSLGSVVDDTDQEFIDRGITRLELPDTDLRPDKMGVRRDRRWNDGIRQYNAITLPAMVDRRKFFARFTPAEREEIRHRSRNGTAQEQRRLGAFLDELQLIEEVDVIDTRIISLVNAMETGGIIAPGRKTDILKKPDRYP